MEVNESTVLIYDGIREIFNGSGNVVLMSDGLGENQYIYLLNDSLYLFNGVRSEPFIIRRSHLRFRYKLIRKTGGKELEVQNECSGFEEALHEKSGDDKQHKGIDQKTKGT